MSSLEGQVAIISGSASGIGRATALAFAREGATVVVADIDDTGGHAIRQEIERQGGRAVFKRTDVTSPKDCEDMVQAALSSYGRLDIAVNNAAVSDFTPGMLTADEPVATWQRTIELALSSVFYAMRAEIPAMLNAGGSIVNTASIAGIISFQNCPAYVAAKHGVIGLTKAVCNEYASKGIRCNAVAPGHVETPAMAVAEQSDPVSIGAMRDSIPANRFAKPEELAAAILWLASPGAAYVNGACLVADGGFITR